MSVAMQSCEEVRSIIAALPADSEFSAPSAKIEAAKALSRTIFDCAERGGEKFAAFCDLLVDKIGTALAFSKTLKKHSSKRKQMWKSFHSMCEQELPEAWNKFFAEFGIVDVTNSSLVTQHVNLKLFEAMLMRYAQTEQAECEEVPLITSNEANTLRYAAGYIPFALKKRFIKRPEVVSFLSSLGKEGVEISFLDYTKEWIKLVNRGGLFQINDEVFCFFVEIEMKLRRHLPGLFKSNSAIKKNEIVADIVHNEDVLYNWTAVTSDLDDEALSKELLKHIIELYITIRGFSAAGAWMEYYKQSNQCTTKGACALRKDLKKKKTEATLSED